MRCECLGLILLLVTTPITTGFHNKDNAWHVGGSHLPDTDMHLAATVQTTGPMSANDDVVMDSSQLLPNDPEGSSSEFEPTPLPATLQNQDSCSGCQNSTFPEGSPGDIHNDFETSDDDYDPPESSNPPEPSDSIPQIPETEHPDIPPTEPNEPTTHMPEEPEEVPEENAEESRSPSRSPVPVPSRTPSTIPEFSQSQSPIATTSPSSSISNILEPSQSMSPSLAPSNIPGSATPSISTSNSESQTPSVSLSASQSLSPSPSPSQLHPLIKMKLDGTCQHVREALEFPYQYEEYNVAIEHFSQLARSAFTCTPPTRLGPSLTPYCNALLDTLPATSHQEFSSQQLRDLESVFLAPEVEFVMSSSFHVCLAKVGLAVVPSAHWSFIAQIVHYAAVMLKRLMVLTTSQPDSIINEPETASPHTAEESLNAIQNVHGKVTDMVHLLTLLESREQVVLTEPLGVSELKQEILKLLLACEPVIESRHLLLKNREKNAGASSDPDTTNTTRNDLWWKILGSFGLTMGATTLVALAVLAFRSQKHQDIF